MNKYDFDKNPDAAKLLFTYGSKDYFKIPVAAREVPKDTPNSSTVVRSNITLTNEQIQQTVDGVLAAMAAAEAAARAAAEARARAKRKERKAAEEKEAERKAESEREDENNRQRWNTKDPASFQAERERRQAVLEKIAQQKKEQEVKEKAGQAVAAVADKLLGIASSKEGKSTTTGKGATGPAGIGGGIAGQVKDILKDVVLPPKPPAPVTNGPLGSTGSFASNVAKAVEGYTPGPGYNDPENMTGILTLQMNYQVILAAAGGVQYIYPLDNILGGHFEKIDVEGMGTPQVSLGFTSAFIHGKYDEVKDAAFTSGGFAAGPFGADIVYATNEATGKTHMGMATTIGLGLAPLEMHVFLP